MEKAYATSTVVSNSCMLPKDYSYMTNGKCLECKFCYKLSDNHKKRLHLSKYIEEEVRYSSNLYLTPILISRFCEPFLNETHIRHSLFAAQNMIENGSQVIFRTDGNNLLQIDVINFLKNNSKNIQVQLKVFCDESTLIGKNIKNNLCPKRSSALLGLQKLQSLHKYNIDTVMVIDPYIIGVNNFDALRLIEIASDLDIKKIIIKQLFATEYFFNFLSIMMDKKFTSLLSERVGKYRTYNNTNLLSSALDIFELADRKEIDVSFCMNKEINQIINLKYNNCCMLENPCGIYDLTQNLMYRGKGCKITRPN